MRSARCASGATTSTRARAGGRIDARRDPAPPPCRARRASRDAQDRPAPPARASTVATRSPTQRAARRRDPLRGARSRIGREPVDRLGAEEAVVEPLGDAGRHLVAEGARPTRESHQWAARLRHPGATLDLPPSCLSIEKVRE
jgi:hypothetical protein